MREHNKESESRTAKISIQLQHHASVRRDCYTVSTLDYQHVVLLDAGVCSCGQEICDHRRQVARAITDGDLPAPQHADPEVMTDGGTVAESGEFDNTSDSQSWRNQSVPASTYIPSCTPLDVGEQWEIFLSEKIKDYIFDQHLESIKKSHQRIRYEEYPQLQKAGIDMLFGGIDLKSRENSAWNKKDPDLFIEVENGRDNKKAWSRRELSTFIPYVWETEDRKNIKESVVLIKNKGFFEWVDYITDNHTQLSSGKSKGVIIPIKDVPPQYIDKNIDLTLDKDLPVAIDKLVRFKKLLKEANKIAGV